MEYKLESWQTFKKRENPIILQCRGDEKYWIKETIDPTMISLGWGFKWIADFGFTKSKEFATEFNNNKQYFIWNN